MLAGVVFTGDDHRLGYVWQPVECCFDFAEFDPESADLDLIVGAADEFQFALGGPPHQVAGAIHPLAGTAERVGDEPFRREVGAGIVAACQSGPGQIQFAGHAGRQQSQSLVQDVGAHAVHGPADGDGGRLGGDGTGYRGVGGEGRGLGRAVDVHDSCVWESIGGCAHSRRGNELASSPDLGKTFQPGWAFLDEEVEQGGGKKDRGDFLLGDDLGQPGGLEDSGGCHDDASAVEQGDPYLVGGGVEGVRGVHEHAGVCGGVPGTIGGQRDHVGVGHGHAFGQSGRSGGEHHIREPFATCTPVPRPIQAEAATIPIGRPIPTATSHGAAFCGPRVYLTSRGLTVPAVRIPSAPGLTITDAIPTRLVIVDHQEWETQLCGSFSHCRVGQQDGGVGVLGDPAHAFGREAWMQRHVRAAGLQHREGGDDHLG
ncbi:hypothetical protein Aple_017050 [Acrocarpospora pleiomorpha]|uniref:Uncharacterized protein n=1 Tax=Acrocarpospora pleiomorpha TaxID=90975 RepID=A0A5M3XCH5_9ACTN|nr:hypothetical protein Aple_017050 [Acrocarpospora pleiomorpha]